MAPPPTLLKRGRTTVQAFRVTAGSTATKIGNDVPAVAYTSADSNTRDVNHIRRWRGVLWLWQGQDVFSFTDPGPNWVGQSLALAMEAVDNYHHHSGLYPVQVGGAPFLVGAFDGSTSSTANWLKYDGSSWTTGTFGVIGWNPTGYCNSIVYRNTLFMAGIGEDVLAVDLSGPSAAIYSCGTTDRGGLRGFCVWENELWCIAAVGVSGVKLYKFTGSGFAEQLQVGSSVAGIFLSSGANGQYSLFVDQTTGDLIALAPGQTTITGNPGGTYCFRYDHATLTEIDLSTTVVPVALRDGAGGTEDGEDRWTVMADNGQSVGTVTINAYYLARPWNGTYTSYTWNGVGSLMTSNGGGLTYELSTLYAPEGGGSLVWTSGENWVDITNIAAVDGGERLTLLAGGGGTKEIEFRFSAEEEAPAPRATLIASTATGGSATNTTAKMQNVTADGSTVYTVDRNVSADGESTGDRETLMPHIDDTV